MPEVPDNEQAIPSSESPTRSSRRFKRLPVIIAAAFFGIFVLGSVGFVGASALEEHDDFCASCHTVPESTYFQRAATALASANTTIADLATYHYHQAQAKSQSFECIECHRGDSSLGQRVQTLALGAHDGITFVLGKADPTIEKATINQPELVNAACVSCH